MIDSKPIRVHVKFDKELEEILTERFKNGLEKGRKVKATNPRITLAIIRHPSFKKIKDDIIISPLMKVK